MSKHPVMYHLTVRQLAISALHLPVPGIKKQGQFFTLRHWCRVMLLLCSLQFIHAFTTLQGVQHTWLATDAASTAIASRCNITTPLANPPLEHFSFEYKGLIQFRLSITENTGAGFLPAIHITTILNQPDL